MAIDVMGRIWKRPKSELDSSEKWVLTIMADRADDEGVLWYAVETIADLTSMSGRGVQKIMDRLIAKGFVRKIHRRDKSNYYIIALDKFPYVELKKRPKEQGQREQLLAELDAEPDLFGTGERRSGVGVNDVPGRVNVVPNRGEPGSPDSLNGDSLNDSLTNAHAREGGDSIEDTIIQSWNALADQHDKLATVRLKLSEDRKRQIELRTNEGIAQLPGIHDPFTVWRFVFEQIGKSKLLTGQKTAWAASFDWILKKANFAKIIGGNYGHGHDEIGTITAGTNGRSAVAAVREARRIAGSARLRPAAAGRGSARRR